VSTIHPIASCALERAYAEFSAVRRGDEARDGALPLDPDLFAELDRRWTAHLGNPHAALGWDEVYCQLGIK